MARIGDEERVIDTPPNRLVVFEGAKVLHKATPIAEGEAVIHVVGASSITIVDTSAIEHSSIASAELGQPIVMTGVRLHVLTAGGTFNLHTRKAMPPAEGAD